MRTPKGIAHSELESCAAALALKPNLGAAGDPTRRMLRCERGRTGAPALARARILGLSQPLTGRRLRIL
jgi:hypothetical protein